MSISSHKGHFFQSDISLETEARRARKRTELKSNGDPITLQTKALYLLADPLSSKHIFVAEAGNVARKIDIENKSNPNVKLYRGHTAPVVCLALNANASTLFTGSWDKRIHAYSVETQKLITVFEGHNDFIKALLYTDILPSKPLLISASADSSIIIWNPETGQRYHTLKGHIRGVQSLAIDPIASTTNIIVLYSGGSNREIKRWIITLASAKEDVEGEIIQHETSLNRIRFLGDEGEMDMWTASSDTTVKRFERQEMDTKRGEVQADTTLEHPNFANDVVMDRTGRWIATACSDEDVRIWDAGSGKLHHTYTGHFDVVNSLAVVGNVLISSSLDATIRQWSLKTVDLQTAIEFEKKKQQSVLNEPGSVSGETTPTTASTTDKKPVLTEEEERELAEIMEDSD